MTEVFVCKNCEHYCCGKQARVIRRGDVNWIMVETEDTWGCLLVNKAGKFVMSGSVLAPDGCPYVAEQVVMSGGNQHVEVKPNKGRL
jgi:hypothetical protein